MNRLRIDAHAHVMHADRNADGKLCPPVRPGWTSGKQSPEAYVAQCRELGIEKILVLDPPHVAFAMQAIFGDFILPAPQVDIDRTTPETIRELFQRGACGIKFIAPMHAYGEDRYFPIYDAIRAHGGLAVFHTGYLGMGMFDPGAPLGRQQVVDITHMRPAAIDRIARAFPALKVLMAHFGNPWWEECWKIISSHPNVYADFSGGTAVRRSMRMWSDMFMPDGRPDVAAIAKLCFATDGSYCFQGLKPEFVERYTAFYDQFFDVVKMTDDLRDKVNRGNILNLTTIAQG